MQKRQRDKEARRSRAQRDTLLSDTLAGAASLVAAAMRGMCASAMEKARQQHV